MVNEGILGVVGGDEAISHLVLVRPRLFNHRGPPVSDHEFVSPAANPAVG
jgi:hypothetical protein